MSRNQQAAQFLFAVAMIGLGILALAYGVHGATWYSVPTWIPWRPVVTYASGVILLASGAGLLFAPRPRSRRASCSGISPSGCACECRR